MARVLISAAHKSSGKTTVTLGLCAALNKTGRKVQPFKKGPDYIDPMWLSLAANNPCYNLDFFTQTHDEINNLFNTKSVGADISIVEGNKGLSDGLDVDGSNSSAALAELLNIPVVMVIDTQGITRSIAPLILGFQQFEPQVNIAGVILNKVGGERHEKKLRKILEEYTDVPVIGAIQRNTEMQIVERHLGLIPSNEASDAKDLIYKIGKIVSDQVDLDKLINIANTAEEHKPTTNHSTQLFKENSKIKIGVLRDEAFGFYYQDDFEEFKRNGAELVYIDALRDNNVGNIDGLFIGGGFPEVKMDGLEKNTALKDKLNILINGGLPVYAECGGLMYLCNGIKWNDKYSKMLGIIDADAIMHDSPVGRGYVYLKKNDSHNWPCRNRSSNIKIPAHEFHYSELEFNSVTDNFCYDVLRGKGIMNKKDGLIANNIVAMYAHQRNTLSNPWVSEFVNFVKEHKS